VLFRSYEQVLQQMLPIVYHNAVHEHNLQPVMDPQIEMLSIDEEKDWLVRATAAEKPEVKLGDYKQGLKGLLKSTEIWIPSAKQDFKKKLDAKSEKLKDPEELKQKQIAEITDWLLKNVEVEPADVLTQQHANTLLARLLDQIQQLGITLEQYLSSTSKKLEDLKAEYAKRAKQDLRLEFMMMELGLQEGVKVEDVEVEKLLADSKDEKVKEALKDNRYKQQLKSILLRQKLIDHLLELAA